MTEINLPATPDWTHPDVDAYAGDLLRRDAVLADVVTHCRGRLAYLATPYSKITLSSDGSWNYWPPLVSMDLAARWARLLGLEGVTAISPIIQAVEMVRAEVCEVSRVSLSPPDPLDAAFWESWCRPLLLKADVVIVRPIDGWATNTCIWAEACAALKTNRRVFLIKPGEEFGGAG